MERIKLPTAVVNLRKIWQQKKIEMHFTQDQAAKDLGWTQGAISHYLNDITHLGPGAIVKLANFLGVDPREIDPNIEEHLPDTAKIIINKKASDMSKNLQHYVYDRNNDILTYILLDKTVNIEKTDLKIETSFLNNAHLAVCMPAQFPQAKLFAITLKKAQELKLYLKADIPPIEEIAKKWAVVKVVYM